MFSLVTRAASNAAGQLITFCPAGHVPLKSARNSARVLASTQAVIRVEVVAAGLATLGAADSAAAANAPPAKAGVA
jgi:hypothetical protein